MTKDDPHSRATGPRPVGELLPAACKPSHPPTHRRGLEDPFLVDANTVDANTEGTILFQHSVLCQTSLPYRDPGEEVRVWKRTNGLVSLLVSAGQAFHPDFVDVGLPYGAKPRLVRYHLNAEALLVYPPAVPPRPWGYIAFVARRPEPRGANDPLIHGTCYGEWHSTTCCQCRAAPLESTQSAQTLLPNGRQKAPNWTLRRSQLDGIISGGVKGAEPRGKGVSALR